MLIFKAISSKIEFPVGWVEWGAWDGCGGFRLIMLSMLVLIEMMIRIKTRLWQYCAAENES